MKEFRVPYANARVRLCSVGSLTTAAMSLEISKPEARKSIPASTTHGTSVRSSRMGSTCEAATSKMTTANAGTGNHPALSRTELSCVTRLLPRSVTAAATSGIAMTSKAGHSSSKSRTPDSSNSVNRNRYTGSNTSCTNRTIGVSAVASTASPPPSWLKVMNPSLCTARATPTITPAPGRHHRA